MEGGSGMAPRSSTAWSSTGPWTANANVTSPLSPFASTVASSCPRKQTLPSSPKRTTSPSASRFAGFTKARQRDPSSRWWSVASIAGSVAPRPSRRPRSRAGMTFVSFTINASPGRSKSGRSPTLRSSNCTGAPGRTTRSRAASRGATGRSAIRSPGSSKSNKSVRMPLHTGTRTHGHRLRRHAGKWNQTEAYRTRAHPDRIESGCALDSSTFAHVLVGKPVPTFPGHALEGGRIQVESVGPHRRGFAVLVDPQDLRLLALLPELLGGIDREQHRLALAEVGPEFLAVERDEPDVLLAYDQIARA